MKDRLSLAARALGLNVQPWEIRPTDGLDKLFAALSKERQDGIFVISSPLMNANQNRIAGFTIKNRLPSVHVTRDYVDAGGLLSYGADLAESYRHVATYVDRILKGNKPADLPVEQPTKFELAVNLKTAQQIGLAIPPQVLARADRVIR